MAARFSDARYKPPIPKMWILVLALLSSVICRVEGALGNTPTTVAHESLITPAPVLWDVDALQRAWPTSDAVPVGAVCGDGYPPCECPGKCSSMELYDRSYCKFCPETPCPSSCTSTSSPNWLCSGCLCPRSTSTGCATLSCGSTCSTGVWYTTTYQGFECPYCTCSYTPPATPCPLVTCTGACRPAPQCGLTAYQVSTYLPGESCPSCTCMQGVVCSVLPCHGPCSTGSLSYTTDPCAPPGCWGCSCHPVTTPCRTVTGCTGTCEGGTLGIVTVEECSTRCPEYCGCKSTSEIGSPVGLTATPTLSAVPQEMTGVVMAVGEDEMVSRVKKRGYAFEPVVTTVTI